MTLHVKMMCDCDVQQLQMQEKIKLQLELLDAIQSRRTVLCIVIRDIDPDQQDDNARARVFKQHLETTWEQLIKPPGLQASNIDDYFQVQ